ncbi:18617_t:CDS:2, partial [Gigaspora rosea]
KTTVIKTNHLNDITTSQVQIETDTDIEDELIRDLEFEDEDGLHEQPIYYLGTSDDEGGEIYDNPWINETSNGWIKMNNLALYLTDIPTNSIEDEVNKKPSKEELKQKKDKHPD